MIALVFAAALQASSPDEGASAQPVRSPELQARITANPELLQPATWAESPGQADWPPAAFEAEIEGEVTLLCVVDTSGRARVCEIVSETPEGFGFGDSTMAGQDLFRWHTARFDGEAIESQVQFRVNFRIEEAKRPSPELEAILRPVAEAISADGYATGRCARFADPATVQHWNEMRSVVRERPNAEHRFYDHVFTNGYTQGREYAARRSDPTESQCADLRQWADRLQKEAAPALRKLEALSLPGDLDQFRPIADVP